MLIAPTTASISCTSTVGCGLGIAARVRDEAVQARPEQDHRRACCVANDSLCMSRTSEQSRNMGRRIARCRTRRHSHQSGGPLAQGTRARSASSPRIARRCARSPTNRSRCSRTSRRRRSSRWRTRGCWANCANAPRRSAELNRGLEARVAEQVEELGRVGRLKRFLAPQLAELIVSQGDEKILESHRREIVVVFCDLRGYTAFTETAEPEEVLDFLREYHGALGPLVSQFEGTLDQFSGDGIMVFFNDPVPIPDPAERAVKMAMAMREAAGKLIASWRRRGRELGFGARHRPGLRDARPDRLRRALRLHRDRHRVQSRRTAVR